MIIVIAPNINNDPLKRFDLILINGFWLQLWYLIIFVFFGMFLFLLNTKIHQHAECDSTKLGQLSIIVGYLWSSYVVACGIICIASIEFILKLPGDQQKNVWLDIYAMQIGIGEGIEWVGGLWMCLLHFHLFQSKIITPIFTLWGLVIAVAGLLTIFPRLADSGMVFGILQIIWFVQINIMLNKVTPASTSK